VDKVLVNDASGAEARYRQRKLFAALKRLRQPKPDFFSKLLMPCPTVRQAKLRTLTACDSVPTLSLKSARRMGHPVVIIVDCELVD
jgi:hypothetical protein